MSYQYKNMLIIISCYQSDPHLI